MWLEIILVENNISLENLKELANNRFWDMVKAVVDIERNIMALNAWLHADEEWFLLENWSLQNNLRWINLYVNEYPNASRIEFDSMINVRPNQNNKSRSIEDEKIKLKIIETVNLLVKN